MNLEIEHAQVTIHGFILIFICTYQILYAKSSFSSVRAQHTFFEKGSINIITN